MTESTLISLIAFAAGFLAASPLGYALFQLLIRPLVRRGPVRVTYRVSEGRSVTDEVDPDDLESVNRFLDRHRKAREQAGATEAAEAAAP